MPISFSARRPAVLGLFALLLASCDLFGSGDAEPKDLVPLAVGNYWVYSSWYLEPSIADTFRVEITRKVPVTLGGRTFSAFAWTYQFGDRPEPYAFVYANAEGGLYDIGGIAETDTMFFKRLSLKYPARVGDTWPFVRLAISRDTGDFYNQDTLAMSLVAKDKPFTTPAGTFRCYVYKYSFKPAEDVSAHWNVYRYYAPGIGNVAEIIKSQIPGESELKEVTAQSVLNEYGLR